MIVSHPWASQGVRCDDCVTPVGGIPTRRRNSPRLTSSDARPSGTFRRAQASCSPSLAFKVATSLVSLASSPSRSSALASPDLLHPHGPGERWLERPSTTVASSCTAGSTRSVLVDLRKRCVRDAYERRKRGVGDLALYGIGGDAAPRLGHQPCKGAGGAAQRRLPLAVVAAPQHPLRPLRRAQNQSQEGRQYIPS
eukprot:1182277-Prorocentrum_minimum.AAC.1